MSHHFKYPFARYKVNGVVHTIGQHELTNPSRLIDARSNYLVEPNTTERLYVRRGKKNLYFRKHAFSAVERTTIRRHETDSRHSLEQLYILNELSGNAARFVKKTPSGEKIISIPAKTVPSTIEIVAEEMSYGSKRTKPSHKIAQFASSAYVWDKEVSRACVAGSRIQHDLFGQDGGLPTSRLRPQIAIEVVYEHSPEDKALDAMLHQSEVSPLLVLFAFPRVGRKMFYLRCESSVLTIRPTLYIWCGELFHEDRPTGIQTQIEFDALRTSLEEQHLRGK